MSGSSSLLYVFLVHVISIRSRTSLKALLQITAVQWLIDWYPQGKTSTESRWNVPGRIGWAAMESTGPITLLYIFSTLPKELGIAELPWGNWTMAGCYVCQLLLSTAKIADQNTDDSLRLPRCHLAAFPQSKHVAHESACLPVDACFPGHQRYLDRWISLGLWADYYYRPSMARPCRMDVSWTGSLVLGPAGQHVP